MTLHRPYTYYKNTTIVVVSEYPRILLRPGTSWLSIVEQQQKFSQFFFHGILSQAGHFRFQNLSVLIKRHRQNSFSAPLFLEEQTKRKSYSSISACACCPGRRH